MDRKTLMQVLGLIRPGASWTIHERRDENNIPLPCALVWCDKTQAQPTDAELEAGQATVEALSYREARAKEYPSVQDQLDAIWQMIQANPPSVMPTATTNILQKIQAVKAKYRAPVGGSVASSSPT